MSLATRQSRPFASPGRAAGRAEQAEPDDVAEPSRDRLRDLTALVLVATVAFLIASLATHHPADPPVPRMVPAHMRATNACGVLGAAVAAFAYEWLGFGAWVATAFLGALTWVQLRRHHLADLPLRAAAAVVATAGACTLVATFLPTWVERPLWGPGGRIGAVGHFFAESHLAHGGAAIVTTAITAAGLFIACDTFVLWCGVALAKAWTWCMAMLAAGSSRIASWGAARAAARTAARATAAAAEDESESLARRFPGLRNRLTGGAARATADEDDDSEEDDESDDEPAIRVRRRDPVRPVDVVEADAEQDEAEDEAEGAGTSDDDAEETVDEAPAAAQPAVPIRSRSRSSRRASEPLAMAPDPVADYELPSLDLLLPTEYLELDQQEQEVRDRARVLEKTFAEFGFKVKVVEVETGPVISQYEIELEAGLRLAKITNLADDLAIALRVPSVRIVAPIPGKNSVGIEVPNTTRQMVRLREVIEETPAKSRTMKIPIFLGKDVAGNPMVVDMASLPHLLIAGRTGTGKSVCLNSIIVSMLMTRRPDEVRMLMIDPKMVELTPYKSLPHLMHPVVTDMKKAEAILAWAVEKMEERYALLAKVGVRHLTQYNALGRDELLRRIGPETEEEAAAIPTTMPFIVMIADEIADMMMTAGKEIEQHIIRLAQKSRAVGIHLILATQKPTVDVITGLIKSNLPARIAFQVASRTDSRVVLDEMGAERLLGNGDMLFLSPGTSQILRGQGTFLSDDEIGRVMAAIGTTEPQYAAELVNLQPAGAADAAGKTGGSPRDKDDLYDAAVEVVIREGRGSVSLLQRALGVGYGRGARLIDFMAEDGVVGQYAGSQAREVLLTMEQWAARNGTAPLPPDPAPRKLTIKPHAVAAAAAAPVIDVDEEVDREEAFVEDEIDEDEDTSDEEESSTDVEDSADEWEEEDGDESEDWDDEGDLEDDEDA
ncbi:MAG: DNA translocase FtsK [Planctomycetia bacterium]|nr:DNA translocase FtsK [Planctomycetia bacterium]